MSRQHRYNTHVLVVLDDGETYSGLDGASILIVNDEGMDQIIEGGNADDVAQNNVLATILLKDMFAYQAQCDTDDEGNVG